MATQTESPDPSMAALNPIVTPLMTDMYQISMAYAYWCQGRHEMPATFDLFFRKNPFKGGHTVFAGLEECLNFISNFKFSKSDISYIQSLIPYASDDFLLYLAELDCSDITIYAVKDGSIAFPRLPLIRVEGPLAICQLIETPLLTLTNYSSLVATNASRFKLAAPGKSLLEFGLRRAQGPDGGMTASKYCYLGGFDGTSHVLAGKKFGIPVKGTIAHSFICSYSSLDEIKDCKIKCADKTSVDFVQLVLKWRKDLDGDKTHDGELAAFISYAQARADGFLALIDTYNTLKSGNINFIACTLALDECGYKSVGVRLDSGDLSALSKGVRAYWKEIATKYKKSWIAKMVIFASDGINENKLKKFAEIGHEMDGFGIGTNLVTCQAQPALGCVYKLVEIDKSPCIKLSNSFAKISLPSKKDTYRFYGQDGKPVCDVLLESSEKAPQAKEVFKAFSPFTMPNEQKEIDICPVKVEPLLKCCWGKDEGKEASLLIKMPELKERRENCLKGLQAFSPDYATVDDPQVYPTYVSDKLYHTLHKLWVKAKI